MKRTRYLVEKRILQTGIISLAIVFLVQYVASFSLFSSVTFWPRYSVYIIYLALTVVTTMITLWHLSAYKDTVTHMTGMMTGMTAGMMSGFTIGAIVGATNGMFIGSLVGVLLGMAMGALAGKCCGIMGIMEGMMAGLMAGTMGPMISVMMLNDNLVFFMPLLVGSSLLIMGGLTYMMHKEEMLQKLPTKYASMEYISFITLCFLLTLGISYLMVFGPKSYLFG